MNEQRRRGNTNEFIDDIPEMMSADQSMPPQQTMHYNAEAAAAAAASAGVDGGIEAQHLNAALEDASDMQGASSSAAPQKKKKKKKKKKAKEVAEDGAALGEEQLAMTETELAAEEEARAAELERQERKL